MDKTSKAQALILVLFGAMGVWAQDLTVTLSYNVRLAPLVTNIFNNNICKSTQRHLARLMNHMTETSIL